MELEEGMGCGRGGDFHWRGGKGARGTRRKEKGKAREDPNAIGVYNDT